MSSERATTTGILTYLRSQGIWAFKVHGSPMQEAGVPDIVACWEGRFLSIEVKAPTGRLSKLQGVQLCRIAQAGGVAVVAHSVDEVKDLLTQLKEQAYHKPSSSSG